jgi:hypothetical protein
MRKRPGFSVSLVAIGSSLVLAACGGGHHNTHVVSGSRAGITRAELDVVSGARSVTVESVALGGGLYRVSTPAGSGLVPVARLNNGRLRVSLRGHGQPAKVTIELSEAVIWNLQFAGGATSLVTNFRTGKLSGVELVAGNSDGVFTLPQPSGTVPIVEQGGLSQLTVKVPGDVQTRLVIDAGAGHVTLDGVTHTGVAGGSVFSSPGWTSAHDRYELHARGGVSSLAVLIEPG